MLNYVPFKVKDTIKQRTCCRMWQTTAHWQALSLGKSHNVWISGQLGEINNIFSNVLLIWKPLRCADEHTECNKKPTQPLMFTASLICFPAACSGWRPKQESWHKRPTKRRCSLQRSHFFLLRPSPLLTHTRFLNEFLNCHSTLLRTYINLFFFTQHSRIYLWLEQLEGSQNHWSI